jgi:hypothetical protein
MRLCFVARRKALTKIHKRKRCEIREAQSSPILSGQTPTVLPELLHPEFTKSTMEPFTLEPPAIAVSTASSRRGGSNVQEVPAEDGARPSRSRGRTPASAIHLAPSVSDSTPTSQRSSIVSSSDTNLNVEDPALRRSRWPRRFAGSS